MSLKIKVENGIILSDEQKRLLAAFVEYCYRALDLQKEYSCYLVKDREKHKIETTAVCFYDKGKIYIYAADRLFSDVLRSIAHEATHLRQVEHGKTPGENYLHFSSDLEDNANELAGKLLNAFSQVMGYKTIYDEHIKTG